MVESRRCVLARFECNGVEVEGEGERVRLEEFVALNRKRERSVLCEESSLV